MTDLRPAARRLRRWREHHRLARTVLEAFDDYVARWGPLLPWVGVTS